MLRFSGECHAVELRPRENAPNPLVVILTEDDGNWFESMAFDSHWLPQLIKLLQLVGASEGKDGGR